MRLLLDSHVALWWLAEPARLEPAARSAIEDPAHLLYVSAASIWEIGLKVSKGKLRVPAGYAELLWAEGMQPLPISVAHAQAAIELPPIHADPFDRLLVAQARLEGLTLVTRDALISGYAVPTLRA